MEKTKTIGRVMAALEQGLLRPSSAVAAACDPAATRRFLELLRAPEVNCTEFRVLRAGLDRQGKIRRAEDVGLHQGGSTLAGWYDDMELLTAHTRRLARSRVRESPENSLGMIRVFCSTPLRCGFGFES